MPDIADAINDPERPLSVDPNVWLEMRTRRGSAAVEAAPAPSPQDEQLSPPTEEEPLVMMDQAIDAMVASIKTMYESLNLISTSSAEEKVAVKKVKDLLDTAMSPYLSDIIDALDVFEEIGLE